MGCRFNSGFCSREQGPLHRRAGTSAITVEAFGRSKFYGGLQLPTVARFFYLLQIIE